MNEGIFSNELCIAKKSKTKQREVQEMFSSERYCLALRVY